MKERDRALDFGDFISEFESQPDRSAVIIGSIRLELLLEQLLLKNFIPNKNKQEEELFDPGKPLSSFHAKIHLSYRLGLIDEGLFQILDLIRQIRNDFAHHLVGCTLESEEQKCRVNKIVAPLQKHKGFNGAKNIISKKHSCNKENSIQEALSIQILSNESINFRAAIAVITFLLGVQLKHVNPIKMQGVFPLTLQYEIRYE